MVTTPSFTVTSSAAPRTSASLASFWRTLSEIASSEVAPGFCCAISIGRARVTSSNRAISRGSMLLFYIPSSGFLYAARHTAPVRGRQEFGVLAPVRPDLHESLQENLLAHQRFDLAPCQRADLLKQRSARANQNGFLSGTLDIDGCGDAQQRACVLPLLDHHRHGVGDLLVRQVESFLADDFRRQKTLRLIGQVILG